MGNAARHGVRVCLLVVVVIAGCSRGAGDPPEPRTVAVDAEEVESNGLAAALAGLCLAREQASGDARAAKETYERRSRVGVDATARALQDSYSIAASAVAELAQVVEADFATDPPRPSLVLDLARLAEVMREGLARLGILTRPCPR